MLSIFKKFTLRTAVKLIAIMSTAPLGAPAIAAGDLLVAPTRVVLEGSRGTEVILNNIGAETATYRISLELRRMTPGGDLEDVALESANAKETAALEMIRYAPRRVTLLPNQPQAIRIGVRPPADLPDGEYRAHMLFRAIPDVTPVVEQPENDTGFSIALTPIYGVTIPIIIRQGRFEATAVLANPRIQGEQGNKAFSFELSSNGSRSVYGEIRVMKPGESEPMLLARGIAIYPEITSRTVSIPVSDDVAAKLNGPVSLEYYRSDSEGGGLITKMSAVIK